MIFNDYDLDQCKSSVLKASEHNQQVHLVPTIYARLHKKKIKKYLYRDRHGNFQEFSDDYLKSYHKRILSCVEYSKRLNLKIHVTPHVDDAAEKGVLRYFINYSPTQSYSGYSFAQIMFYYLNKLKVETKKQTYLSLIGETDLSLYHHLHDYKRVIRKLSNELKLGLSFSLLQSQIGLPHFRKVSFINQLDFLGVSAYNSIKQNCSSRSFERIAQKFWKNMRKLGMTKKLPLHFTEVGLGGSLKGAFYTALLPIKGQTGEYQKSQDPWQIKSNYEFRKKYFQCLLSFLKKTPTIDVAFLWNSDSWDVQGFYPFSAKYRDEYISELIEDHNQQAAY